MARDFSPATAEHVVSVVEGVVVSQQPANVDYVSSFADLTPALAEAALALACDLGLLSKDHSDYAVASPLCRFLITPNGAQRAAVIRVLLESYPPFLTFRERLVGTGSASTAAGQTKTALDLTAHREEIKDTLVSLGTYSDALVTEGGGRFAPQPANAENPLEVLALAAGDGAAAEGRIRAQIGEDACRLVSREDVIVPLANALLRATGGDPRGAVVEAGNAVESYLVALGGRAQVELTGATGINSKLDKFDRANWLSKKLVYVGKHLGHVRNAADHGIDPEVGQVWAIRPSTALEYVFHACSFVASVTTKELGRQAEI
ncbi:MAG TPA: hypothetical protein VGK32_23770 [Vicinamibacterales bacterium]|jgi:hypothetical protein